MKKKAEKKIKDKDLDALWGQILHQDKDGLFHSPINNKYGYKYTKLVSDNIDWIAECEVFRVKV